MAPKSRTAVSPLTSDPTLLAQRTVNRRRFLFAPLVLAYAVVMLFALVTYDWRDVSWMANPPNAVTTNAMGYLGAWMTFMGYAFAGLAYRWCVLPLAFILFCFLCHGHVAYFRLRLLWMFLFYVVAACLFQLGNHTESLIALNFRPNAGGALGQWVATTWLEPFMGRLGSRTFLWLLLFFFAMLIIGVRNCIFVGVHLMTKRPRQHEEPSAAPPIRDLLRERIAPAPQREEEEASPTPTGFWGSLFKKKEQPEAEAPQDIRDLLGERTPPLQMPTEQWGRTQDADATASLFETKPKAKPTPKRTTKEEPFTLNADNPAELKPMKRAATVTAPVPAVNDNTQADANESMPLPDYGLPTTALLDPIPKQTAISGDASSAVTAIESVFNEFALDAKVVNYIRGPVLTQFEIKPAPNIKIQLFKNYEHNLLMALRAQNIRIQTPIPGRDVIGIEVPNAKSQPVTLREILESTAWKVAERKMALPLAMGKTSVGEDLVVDLAEMPHLLVAGGTGSGKSVAVNDMLMGLLMSRKPEQLRLLMIDPKRVEFTFYEDLPHLLNPVVYDPKKVVFCLRWALLEMEKRYRALQKFGVKNIADYNHHVDKPVPNRDNPTEKLPYIVIVIDELADLMLSVKAEIEGPITSLTQKARAAGIHMIIATQRPTTDIVTGTIKANIPGRLALRVAQGNDSRTILGESGAERLIGKGDMLLARGGKNTVRSQAAWISDDEIIRVCDFIKEQAGPAFDHTLSTNVNRIQEEQENNGIENALTGLVDAPPPTAENVNLGDEEDKSDEGYYKRALELIRQTGRFSTSAMQRRLGIGYNKAGRITDMLEDRGIIGPQMGNAPRTILVDLNALERERYAGTDAEEAITDTRSEMPPSEESELSPFTPESEDFDMDLDPDALDDDANGERTLD